MSQKSIIQLRTWIQEQDIDAFLITQPQNRSYLSGWLNDDIEGAGMLLVSKEQQFLLTNGIYKESATTEAIGWEVVVPEAREYAPAFATLAQKHGWKKIGFESMALLYGEYEKFRAASEGTYEFLPFDEDIVGKMRQVKRPDEIELLKHAIAITDETFAHLCQWIQPGMRWRLRVRW